MPGIGYCSIQKDAENFYNQDAPAIVFFSGNPQPVALRNFAPNYILLGVDDLLLVEAWCCASMHAFQAVYEVLWTRA